MIGTAKTIVSLTPMALDRDSRTLKIAASFSRLGYQSVVVENRQSGSRYADLGLDVITLGMGRTKADQPSVAAERTVVPRALRERAHFIRFVLAYFFLRPVQGLFQVPAAGLYYLHEYRLFPILWLLSLFRPTPFIYDAHDFYPEVYNDSSLSHFWKKRFMPFLVWMERWCARHADIVVTVGEGVGELFEQRYGIRPQILSNAHDPRLENAPEQGLRQRLGLSDQDFLVVVVGNHKPGQVVEPFIMAMAELPDTVHLAFVGHFHEGTAELAERHGVRARVHTPGAVKPEQVVPYIRSADVAAILYYPVTGNYKNIIPNGFFQSLSAELPLLYPDLPEIMKVIAKRPVGCEMDPTDQSSLAEGLSWMLDNRDELGHFRENLRVLSDQTGWRHQETRLGQLVEMRLT